MPFVQSGRSRYWVDQDKSETMWCAFRQHVTAIQDAVEARLQHCVIPDQSGFVQIARVVAHGMLRHADLNVIHAGYKGPERRRAFVWDENAQIVEPVE
jgi:hypothetical protein